MCGIIGHLNLTKAVEKETFIRLRDTLTHRGPDGEGLYFSKDGLCALGHRRLAIIDLSKRGNQPMSNEEKTLWLVCNGEVYNFKELREELKKKGHYFVSTSDSEVILHAYEEWKEKSFNRLRGMYAFALWDEISKKLILVRDRLGIKPLYYYFDGDQFIFASEIKAIISGKSFKREINFAALFDYLIHRYVGTPETIWKNISKLPPGHFLTYQEGRIILTKYWDLEIEEREIKEREALEKLNDLLLEVVKIHLRSDVPIGIFLSGGLDSSMICALASKSTNQTIRTFTIDLKPEKFSEEKYANLIARQFSTYHIVEEVNLKEVMNVLPQIVNIFDEPLADSSIFPTFILSREAAKHLKVILSGEGGDEVFCGYRWYYIFSMLKAIPFPVRAFLYCLSFLIPKKAKANFPLNLLNFLSLNDIEMYRKTVFDRFTVREVRELLHPDITSDIEPFKENTYLYLKYFKERKSGIKLFQYIDIKTYMLDDILAKVDKLSMAHSLEVRVPLLDHKLIEFIFKLPQSLTFYKRENKYLWKKIAQRYLPKEIIQRKKQGFSAPLAEWKFVESNIDLLYQSELVKDGILQKKKVDTYLKNKNLKENINKLWMLIMLELWYRKWASLKG